MSSPYFTLLGSRPSLLNFFLVSVFFTALTWAGFYDRFLILVAMRCEQDRITVQAVTEKSHFSFFLFFLVWNSVNQWIFSVCEGQISSFFEGQVAIHQPIIFKHHIIYVTSDCHWWEDSESRSVNWWYCMFGLSQWAAGLLTECRWCSYLLFLFYVVMFSLTLHEFILNLPVISVFDILHAVSFNHSGLRWLPAWLRAVQTSAQHWNFCTDWIITFWFLKYATHWIFILWWCCESVSPWSMWNTCLGPIVVMLLNGFIQAGWKISTDAFPAKSGASLIWEFSPGQNWTQVISLPLNWTYRMWD